jgi:hypothetical protein
MTSFHNKFSELKALENKARELSSRDYSGLSMDNPDGRGKYSSEFDIPFKPIDIDYFIKCLISSQVAGYVKLGEFLKEVYNNISIDEAKYEAYDVDVNQKYGDVDRKLANIINNASNSSNLSHARRSINIVYRHVKKSEMHARRINNKHMRMLRRARKVYEFMTVDYLNVLEQLKQAGASPNQYDIAKVLDSIPQLNFVHAKFKTR